MKLPDNTVTIRTYDEFRDDVRAFCSGRFNFVIVIGNTGLGKTESVQEMVGPHYLLEGCPSAWKFYCGLYDHRDETVIMDDVSPRFFSDPNCQALLKCLTNSRSTKRLQWETASTGPRKDYPSAFETTSCCIILTNEWTRPISEHVRAIEGRANIFVFDPSPDDVMHEVADRGWFHDQEVFDFVWEHRQFITRPDMRIFPRIAEQKRANRPWRKRALEMLIGDQRLVELAELLKDPSFPSNRKRAEEFARRGYRYGRTTFYKLIRDFRWYSETAPSTEPPKLQVKKQPPTIARSILGSPEETTSWIHPTLEERCRIFPYRRQDPPKESESPTPVRG